ncbi:MAG: hypothetical protein QOD30_476, partial [Actinomycetota bacterium]|nr:hypothetical protein [Actinomycetota bacterium]
MAIAATSSATSWLDRFRSRAGQHRDVESVDPGALDPALAAVAIPSLAI